MVEANEVQEIFSANIVGIISTLGWSQAYLAKQVGMCQMKMSRLLRNQPPLHLADAINISEVLAVPLESIIRKRLSKKEISSLVSHLRQ